MAQAEATVLESAEQRKQVQVDLFPSGSLSLQQTRMYPSNPLSKQGCARATLG